MSRFLKIWLLLMVIGHVAFAQQELRVSVTDKDSRQPVFLAYVNVYAANNALITTEQTDEMGVATVRAIKYPCTIEVVASGYGSFKKEYNTAPVNTELSVPIIKKFNSLNEVVITGLNQPQKMKDALSLYQVVTKAAIDAQGAVTLDEVLKNQLNMRISNDNILGAGVGMQGMTGNKVKILIDGIPMNGRENGNINLGQINMNNVDHIEMIQGPMSVVYGSDALGGVINIITKKENKPFGVFANTHVETVGKYNFDGGVTFKPGKKSQFTIGGGRNYFQGWNYLDTTLTTDKGETLTPQRNLQFKPVEQYIGNVAYNYTAESGFKLNIASDYLHEKVTNRGLVDTWEPFLSKATDEYYRTKRYMNRLSLAGKIGRNGHWQSQNGYAVYDRTRTTVIKNMSTLVEIPSAEKGSQDTSLFQDLYLRGSYNNKIKKISYTAGYDINLQYAHSLKIDGVSKTIQDYAVYANISVPLVDNKLTTQVGGRASYNSSYKPPVIPNINLLYTPIEKLQVRASYTHGYRAPSLKEMYLSFIDQNHMLIGNTNLKAEHSRHMQVSASYQVYEKQANYLQLIVTGYYNDVKDGIVLLPIHPEDKNSIEYKYGNLAEQKNVIATLGLESQWSNFHTQLGFSTNFTFAQASYNAFSASEATANMQYNWKKRAINFGVFYKFTAPQPMLLNSIDGDVTFMGRQQALHFCDASVDRRFFNKKLQVILGVKNIFDLQRPQVSGVATGGSHTSSIGSFLPRSYFTTLKLNID